MNRKMQTATFDKLLDVRDRVCPYPMVMTMNAVKKMKGGEILKVISNVESIKNDLPAWCDKTGNIILSQETEGSDIVFYTSRSLKSLKMP